MAEPDQWSQILNEMYARHGHWQMTMDAPSEGMPTEEIQKAVDRAVPFVQSEIEAEALHNWARARGARSPFDPPPQDFRFVPGKAENQQ